MLQKFKMIVSLILRCFTCLILFGLLHWHRLVGNTLLRFPSITPSAPILQRRAKKFNACSSKFYRALYPQRFQAVELLQNDTAPSGTHSA